MCVCGLQTLSPVTNYQKQRKLTRVESSEYTDEYVMDPDDHEGLRIYEESGVSLTYVNGIFYTPPGFKRSRVKCARPNSDFSERDEAEAEDTNTTAKRRLLD